MASRGKDSGDAQSPSWTTWEAEHREVTEKATEPQLALLRAAVQFVEETGNQATMVRAAAFFLLHTGMGLTPAQVGAAVGRTDRAMRTVQGLSAREFLESVWAEMGRHRKPKLSPEHAGPIALYIVDHPHCTQLEMVSFIERSFGITVDPITLRRFFKRYSFGVLRNEDGEQGTDARPFGSDERASAERSSSYRQRSR